MGVWFTFKYSFLYCSTPDQAICTLVSFQGLYKDSPSALKASDERKGDSRQAIEQTMERLPGGVRRLAAQLRTHVSVDSLWKVLTDYEHLSEFIPNLAKSSLVERNENCVKLNQVGCQKLMGLKFSAQVQIELIEKRSIGQLQFHMLKGDFRRFEGAWTIKKLPDGGSSLVYELTVQGCVGMPVALIEKQLKQDLNANLFSVEQEAIRRSKNI